MAKAYRPNLTDSDARTRPYAGGKPGGNIVDSGNVVKGMITWQRMAGNKSNPDTRARGVLVDPNTKDKSYRHGAER